MGREPEKIRLHAERERVLAPSRLFAPDPANPNRIDPAARELPLPEGLPSRISAAQELVKFLDSSFPDVRRLAASALSGAHAQVRQYAAKAVARYPKEGYCVLDTMKDVARDGTAPECVRVAVAAIQTAVRTQQSVSSHFCRRCRKRISLAEYRASMDHFGNAYCHHCLDEKEPEAHDFESTVEAAKKKRSTGGTAVQSWGEKRIAEFLEAERIACYCDERYRISGGDTICPDFHLPEFDLYIEYYGMDTPEYNANRRRKHFLYQRAAKKLISVSFEHDANLIATLKEKLARSIRFDSPPRRGKGKGSRSMGDRSGVRRRFDFDRLPAHLTRCARSGAPESTLRRGLGTVVPARNERSE